MTNSTKTKQEDESTLSRLELTVMLAISAAAGIGVYWFFGKGGAAVFLCIMLLCAIRKIGSGLGEEKSQTDAVHSVPLRIAHDVTTTPFSLSFIRHAKTEIPR